MEKFSVKKPFTILVAVIMVLLLGFVSITNLQTNLLPDISTPYLMVVTVYPGASPERVESEVSDVMENALCLSLIHILKDFQPVSIKMAKEQGLSLNPAKISGAAAHPQIAGDGVDLEHSAEAVRRADSAAHHGHDAVQVLVGALLVGQTAHQALSLIHI